MYHVFKVALRLNALWLPLEIEPVLVSVDRFSQGILGEPTVSTEVDAAR